ncbi:MULTISPECIES: hypothetical protein [Heyndrickxia]|uniref:hypothetical protein n=1 Tax=Heyndrickxia TaxID=2837504 RepID=UPI00267A1131
MLNRMGHIALLLEKPGTPYIFEILRIRQYSKSMLSILNDTFYITIVYFYAANTWTLFGQ